MVMHERTKQAKKEVKRLTTNKDNLNEELAQVLQIQMHAYTLY